MMGNIYVLGGGWTLNAIGAFSLNQEVTAPFSNLLHPLPSRAWKSLNLTAVRGVLRHSTPVSWDTIYLGYTNISSTGTWRITSSNTEANLWTTPTEDSGHFSFWMSSNLDSWPTTDSIGTFLTPRTSRYIGIEIIDNANPDGYIHAGVVKVGLTFRPDIGYDPSDSRGWNWVDESVPTKLRSSETIFRREPKKMTGHFVLPNQRYNTAFFWRDLARFYGKSYPMVVKTIPLTSAFHQHSICYGYVEISVTEKSLVPPGYSNVTLEINEV